MVELVKERAGERFQSDDVIEPFNHGPARQLGEIATFRLDTVMGRCAGPAIFQGLGVAGITGDKDGSGP